MGKYTSDDNRSMQLNPNNERYRSSRVCDGGDPDFGRELSVDEFKQFKKGGKIKCPCCPTGAWKIEKITEVSGLRGVSVSVNVRDTAKRWIATTIRFHESENYELGHAILHRRNRYELMESFDINSLQSIA